MSKSKKNRAILGNTAYTMGGMLLMNGVLQILIYPLMTKSMGADAMGNVLYIMGLVSILCPSVGQALNTSRLVVRREYEVTNGDYNFSLFLMGTIGSLAALYIGRRSIHTPLAFAAVFLLFMMTILRYYGDVEYRLNLNYRRFFIYYGFVSVGYLLGFLCYLLTDSWILIFLLGETAAVGYVAVTGSIFRQPFVVSPYKQTALIKGTFLILSYLITNLTMNIDRLALKELLGNVEVTQYYVVSLIGKTMVLLIAPVNTIVISYLTKRKETLNKKQFLKAVGAGLAVSAIFLIGCQIATPLFIWLFYRDLYASVSSLVTVVNISQILGLLSAFLFILVLTFTDEKWQLLLQTVHLVILAGLILLITPVYGLLGFSWAVLIANSIRILAVIVLGVAKARHS